MKMLNLAVAALAVLGLVSGCGHCAGGGKACPEGFQEDFDLKSCTLSTTGRNDYWILEPGYQLVLREKGEQVIITVLDDTEVVDGVTTRVVEERESENGELKEVSRNFFVICKEHNDVFYFGEDVDDYEDGKITGHGGAWRAGVNSAKAGLMMPAKPRKGYRHYQEIAPKVAMDRAEIAKTDYAKKVPAGEFKNCLKVVETTPLESGKSKKVYAPGVGLVYDDGLELVAYGKDAAKKAPADAAFEEVEIKESEMPADLLVKVKALHPDGRIKEVKRETHAGSRIVYAVEIMVGEKQYDVEITPKGEVIRDEEEK